MTRRRTLYLPMMITAAGVACAVALLAISEKAEATFPGKNGRIAYAASDGNDLEIYTNNPTGERPFTHAYSARDAPSETHRGFQPSSGKGPAYNASEKLQLKKTEAGARVTLNWVYAEENYVSIGYQVENLKDDRRVAGHPAELQPLLLFEPLSPREKKYLKKHGLGTEGVDLTDERDTEFRMVDNVGETAYGSRKPAKGPLENLVAFKPKKGLKPSEEHDFRLQVPLYESAVVPPEEKQPSPEPFEFKFDVPVHAVHVVDVNQKVRAKGVTLRLDRVINSPGRPRAVFCYDAGD